MISSTITHFRKTQISFSFTEYADANTLTAECHWQHCQTGQWPPDTADCQSGRPNIPDTRLTLRKAQHQQDKARHPVPCLMLLITSKNIIIKITSHWGIMTQQASKSASNNEQYAEQISCTILQRNSQCCGLKYLLKQSGSLHIFSRCLTGSFSRLNPA